MKRFPMTVEGAEKLRAELELLKRTERPQIIKAIAEARAHGDLRENAEYHAAKERQGFIEGRIADIENKLSFAEVIDITKIPYQGRVIFGSTVTLMHLDTQEEIRYKIVGEDEADIHLQKISIGSPIARALIGKREGEEVTVSTPKGELHYEVVAIKYE